MDSTKKIGTLLKELRKIKKLSQIEVAKSANIAVNSLRLYESNKRQPRFEQLMSILSALDATMGDLLQMRPMVDTPENQEVVEEGLTAMLETIDAFRADQLDKELSALFSKLNLEGKAVAVDAVKTISQNPDYLIDTEQEKPPESHKKPNDGK